MSRVQGRTDAALRQVRRRSRSRQRLLPAHVCVYVSVVHTSVLYRSSLAHRHCTGLVALAWSHASSSWVDGLFLPLWLAAYFQERSQRSLRDIRWLLEQGAPVAALQVPADVAAGERKARTRCVQRSRFVTQLQVVSAHLFVFCRTQRDDEARVTRMKQVLAAAAASDSQDLDHKVHGRWWVPSHRVGLPLLLLLWLCFLELFVHHEDTHGRGACRVVRFWPCRPNAPRSQLLWRHALGLQRVSALQAFFLGGPTTTARVA